MAGPKKRYDNGNKFIKTTDSDGSVTLTRKGGKYDEGSKKKFGHELGKEFRGMAGSAKAATIKEFGGKEANHTAKVMRDTTKERKARHDATFFKHTTKGK